HIAGRRLWRSGDIHVSVDSSGSPLVDLRTLNREQLEKYLIGTLDDPRSLASGIHELGETRGFDTAATGRTADSLTGFPFEDANDEVVRVCQVYIDDNPAMSFPLEGKYAIVSKPTLGNRLIDGIHRETTWVFPGSKDRMTRFARWMTGRPHRTAI